MTAEPRPLLHAGRSKPFSRLWVYIALLAPMAFVAIAKPMWWQRLVTRLHLQMNGAYTERAFLGFVAGGELGVLRDYLKAGMSPNAVADGETALTTALDANRPGAARLLLEAGADPQQANAGKVTPLHYALNLKGRVRYSMLELLVQKGADPNAAADNGHSPITFAERHKDMEAVRILRGEPANGPAALTDSFEDIQASQQARSLIESYFSTGNKENLEEIFSLGGKAAPALLAGLDDPDFRHQIVCVQMLSRIPRLPVDAAPRLERLFGEVQDPNQQRYVIGAWLNTTATDAERMAILEKVLASANLEVVRLGVEEAAGMEIAAAPLVPALRAASDMHRDLRHQIAGTIDTIEGR